MMTTILGRNDINGNLWEGKEIIDEDGDHRIWLSTSIGSMLLVTHINTKDMLKFWLERFPETDNIVNTLGNCVRPADIRAEWALEQMTERLMK
jgi:hypothetical protein